MAERIVEFEGRRISVPADATDAEVAQIIGSQPSAVPTEPPGLAAFPTPGPQMQPPSATPIAAPQRSLVDAIMGPVGHGARGFREGIATVLGLPVDAVNNAPRLLNVLPGVDGVGPISKKPFLGSDHIDNALGGFGLIPEPPAPQGFVERGARRVGKEIGAAAVPAGGALATASRVGVQGARELPGIARMFVEPAAVAPSRYAAKETAMASAAGSGAAVANEAVDPNTTTGQIADFIGALTGAASLGVGNMALRGTKNVFDAVRQNPNFQDQVVKDAVTERIMEAGGYRGTPDAPADAEALIRAIMNPERQTPSQVIPGYRETVADRTGNPGIAALEYGRQQGAGAGRFVEQRGANNEAVDAAMRGVEPTETPGAFRSALSDAREQRLKDAAMGRQTAEDAANSAVQPLTPATTPQQRGEVVRGGIVDARDAARARTEEAYAAANVAGKQVDPAPLTQSLDQAVAGLTEVERGLIPQGTIDRVAALGRPPEAGPVATGILGPDGAPITRDPAPAGPIALKEATDLKSELQRLQRAALADPRAEKGGRNAARVLGQMIDTVDGFVTKNLTPEETGKLDIARGTKFDEAQNFTRAGDPLAQATAQFEGGNFKVGDNRVAGMFVEPQAMDRLFRQVDTPQVRQAIREEVLSRGDLTDAARIDRFVQDYGQQLQRFPGLADELSAASRARTAQAEASAGETALRRDLGTETEPGRGTIGKYLQYSDANANRAMKEVLSAKDPGAAADELVKAVGNNPKALEGARAAFWTELKAQSTSTDNTQRSMGGKQQWRGDWLKSFLDDPRTAAVAEKLYADKPEQMNALRAYADVLDNADLRTRAKASATSGTGQGVSNIMTPETLQSRGYAYMRGQISGTYLATSIAAVVARRAVRSARSEAIERMTDEVLLDPAKAVALLQENNPANRAALAKSAQGWKANELSTIINLAGEDEDKTKDAIMRDAPKGEAPKMRDAGYGR